MTGDRGWQCDEQCINCDNEALVYCDVLFMSSVVSKCFMSLIFVSYVRRIVSQHRLWSLSLVKILLVYFFPFVLSLQWFYLELHNCRGVLPVMFFLQLRFLCHLFKLVSQNNWWEGCVLRTNASIKCLIWSCSNFMTHTISLWKLLCTSL